VADIRIKVGASLDSDLANVFKPLRDEARKARQQIASEGKAIDKQSASSQLTVARDVYREQSKLNRETFKSKVQLERDAGKQMTDIQREQIRATNRLKLQAIQEAAKAERDAAKQTASQETALARRVGADMAKAHGGGMGGSGGRFGGGGVIGYMGGRSMVGSFGSSMSRLGRGAMHMAGSVASGMGVDFDVSSIVRRNVDVAKKSQEIVNSGYQKGAAGPAGVRQDAGKIEDESRKIGTQWGLMPSSVADAHKAFIGVTGDLATSRELMGELAKMSVATGSNIEDVAKAAAKVSAQMPDTADKGKKVLEVMQAVASQGKLGGAEMSTTAKQMAALAAVSNKFSGDSAKNMKMMGVLYQEAIQRGGAKGEAQAATSVMSFVNTFSKPARVKAMAALMPGYNPRDASGFLKNPEETIVKLLRATGGNENKLSKAVMDVRAKSAIGGFQTAFLRASGGKTDKASLDLGEKAVRAEFERLSASLMDNAELEKEAGDRMKDTDKRAQQFQNRLDEVGKSVQTALLPSLEAVAPKLIGIAESFGKIIEWAATNPWQAVVAALGVSAAKALMTETFARALMGGMGGGRGGGGGGVGGIGGGGVMGAIGLGGAIGTGVAAYITAEGIGGWESNKKELGGLTSGLAKMTPEQRKAALPGAVAKFNELSEKRSTLDKVTGFSDAEFKGAKEYLVQQLKAMGLDKGLTAQQAAADHLATVSRLLGETLKVEIMNMPGGMAGPPALPGNGVDNPVPGPWSPAPKIMFGAPGSSL
jgi:hypothetical protein